MDAMECDHIGRIIFSPVPIPEDVVAGLQESFAGRLLTNVELDVPENYNQRAEGTPAPEVVLCMCRSDPKYYRVFKYKNEIDREHYEVAGSSWAVLPSEERWRSFLRGWREMDRMARNATGVEAPDDAFDDVEDLAPSGRRE